MQLLHWIGVPLAAAAPTLAQSSDITATRVQNAGGQTHAKNVIFFVGDGMGISTVSAARIFSVGVDGNLVIDQMPFTALSRTATTDFITPDSAGTMTSMITGQNTNSGVIGFDSSTERQDFNGDGDGARLETLLELAKSNGKKVGVVSTARTTHATPAACYSHVNDRNFEEEIAAQALPTDASYNSALGSGLDLLMGGGRQFFLPSGVVDEEGSTGRRSDGRDLRAEFQSAGYRYVWNQTGFDALTSASLPVLGLFNNSHMEYEYDRILDIGGEPSLTELTTKAIELLDSDEGFVLVIESGRIDHAHHAGNAWRALVETEELDEAIGAAIGAVDLTETLIVVTADHSHVFNIQGYPMRPHHEIPYSVPSFPVEWITGGTHSGLFNVVYGISDSTGEVFEQTDSNGVAMTPLVYGNGPGYRAGRVDPRGAGNPAFGGGESTSPQDPNFMQDAAIPFSSETHSGEDVGIFAIGRGARRLNGTVSNSYCYDLMRNALGL